MDKLLAEAAQGLDLLVLRLALAPTAGDRALTIFVVRKDFDKFIRGFRGSLI